MKWLTKKCLIISALFALQTACVILFQSYENIIWFFQPPLGKSSWRWGFPVMSFQCVMEMSNCAEEGAALPGICGRRGRFYWHRCWSGRQGQSSEHQIVVCCSSLNESASQPGTLWKGEVKRISWNITWAMLQSDSRNKWEFQKGGRSTWGGGSSLTLGAHRMG